MPAEVRPPPTLRVDVPAGHDLPYDHPHTGHRGGDVTTGQSDRSEVDDSAVSPPLAVISWRSDELGSLERCRVLASPDGYVIVGAVELPIDDRPGRIDHRVEVDDGWRTREVRVEIDARSTRRIHVAVREREWWVDGVSRPDLAGATDVDLGWTPATNLMPIRRLALPVGGSATVEVAWLSFPELEWARVTQRYERLGQRSWRYLAGSADHVLTVDHLGLVTRYGDGLWEAAAASSGR